MTDFEFGRLAPPSPVEEFEIIKSVPLEVLKLYLQQRQDMSVHERAIILCCLEISSSTMNVVVATSRSKEE